MDAEWPTCVACAVLSRSFEKTGEAVPDACTTCFNRYCWNGTLDATDRGSYEPAFKLTEIKLQSAAGRVRGGAYAAALAAVVALILL